MAYWFIFKDNELLLKKDNLLHLSSSGSTPFSFEGEAGGVTKINSDASFTIPEGDCPPILPPEGQTIHRVADVPGLPTSDFEARAFAIDKPSELPPNYSFCDLRSSFKKLPLHLYQQAGKCYEIIYWDQHTKYCGICGSPMMMHSDISKKCINCGNEVWPQLATAIIVLIERGDEVLLVRSRNFKRNFYGLVAGFVETGESLEEAVKREVSEETGLQIANIKYFASQPWPYPCGLMIGFTATYAGGEIVLQEEELKEAGWFSRDHLPEIPEKLSIARRLIDYWISKTS